MNKTELEKLHKKRILKDNLTAYAFLSPWIIGFVLFSGMPILISFGLSLTDWSMMGTPKFIGFNNYTKMFASQSFWSSLWITLFFTVVSVIISVIWAFMLAMFLNLNLKCIGLYQFIYFIPAVMPSIALAFSFQMIYNKEAGILNYILYMIFGVKNGPNWLYDKALVYPSVLFVMLFTYATGQMLLIFKAGLKEVPTELYEACELDGATFHQKLWNVTIPYMSPIILFNMVMAAIGSLNNSFSILYPLTGGGPDGATNVLSLAIYNSAFKNYKMGYASALAVILFIIAGLISVLQFAMSKKWVHYDT
jgi:multiple sugar transport system permease protein